MKLRVEGRRVLGLFAFRSFFAQSDSATEIFACSPWQYVLSHVWARFSYILDRRPGRARVEPQAGVFPPRQNPPVSIILIYTVVALMGMVYTKLTAGALSLSTHAASVWVTWVRYRSSRPSDRRGTYYYGIEPSISIHRQK